ncbi:MAG: aminomethyl-transferring glycine dehydrogenase subunit GcvPA [Candidatus Hadarchaeota archaeon]
MGRQFLPSTRESREDMLKEIGVSKIDDLFADIPSEVSLDRKLNIPEGIAEPEVRSHVKNMLSKNKPFTEMPTFLGGGVWPHHIPAHVMSIVQRSEFLTAYTPYQPEVSQGMLQALFEYQSLVAELVGLDVANSSMYDWSTAVGEAALMCARVTGKRRFLVPRLMSSERMSVLKNYTAGAALDVVEVGHDSETGQIRFDELKEKLEAGAAGVYVENPSYLGFLETGVQEIADEAHKAGALFVVGVNPISLGLLKPPGYYGADIVVGEGQPLGNPVSFGGPTLGIFACRGEQKLVRQIPGRLIGMTTTLGGNVRGYTMVLQTREQHIRRERATSNICTNEALCAVAAAAYLASMGPSGLREVAEVCAANAKYAMKKLGKVKGLKVPVFSSPHFNEFTLKCTKKGLSIEKFNARLLKQGVHGGKPVREEFPELGETAVLCTTELHTKDDIDKLAEAAANVVEGGR